MDGRGCQLNVAHAIATHLRTSDLDATALANDALETNALVLTAVALPVASRSEDLLAKQAILFWTQRAVIDCLRLFDFAVAPVTNLICLSEADLQLVEHIDDEVFRAAEELGIDISRPERGTDEDDARREREKAERAGNFR